MSKSFSIIFESPSSEDTIESLSIIIEELGGEFDGNNLNDDNSDKKMLICNFNDSADPLSEVYDVLRILNEDKLSYIATTDKYIERSRNIKCKSRFIINIDGQSEIVEELKYDEADFSSHSLKNTSLSEEDIEKIIEKFMKSEDHNKLPTFKM